VRICVSASSAESAYDSGVSSESFAEEVYALVRSVPPGRVTTYGTISHLLGRMRSARLVGWAMRHCPDDVPAHRVVNASGTLSGGWAFGHPSVQRARLEAEGVQFVAEIRCDLAAHFWPNRDDEIELPTRSE
jgi:methylated-DNA-protein-cysteine methyltransferase related protein